MHKAIYGGTVELANGDVPMSTPAMSETRWQFGCATLAKRQKPMPLLFSDGQSKELSTTVDQFLSYVFFVELL